MRRPSLLLWALLFLLVAGTLHHCTAARTPATRAVGARAPEPATSAPSAAFAPAPPAPAPADPAPVEVLDLASELNASHRTIAQDLQLVDGIFGVWQTNFLREGNPSGDNAEITRALTGANRLRLALIPPDHPAINDRGELCDRWGTPFFFHQLSGTQMEIRSAGPDRQRHTADDAVLTP